MVKPLTTYKIASSRIFLNKLALLFWNVAFLSLIINWMLKYLNANGSSNNVLGKLPYDGSTGGPEIDIGLPYGP